MGKLAYIKYPATELNTWLHDHVRLLFYKLNIHNPASETKKSSSFKWYAFQTLSKAVKVTKINASFMGPSVSMKLQCACRLFKMVKLIWKTLKCWSLQLRHQTGEAFWPALVVYCAEGKRQLPHPDSLPWPWFQGFSLSAQCLCAGQVLH